MIYFICVIGENQLDRVENLRTSLTKYNASLLILPFYNYEKKNLSKIKVIGEFLCNNVWKKTDLFCLLDAFDVLCVENPIPRIETFFEETQADLYFSMEQNFGAHFEPSKCFFQTIMQKKYGKDDFFINSGVIIGKFECLYETFSKMLREWDDLCATIQCTSDQVFWTYFLWKHPYLVGKYCFEFDVHSTLTYTVGFKESVENYREKGSVFCHVWALSTEEQYEKYRWLCEDHFCKAVLKS